MAIRHPGAPPHQGEWSAYHGKQMSEAQFLSIDDAEETDLEYVDGTAVEKGMVDRNHRLLARELDGRLWLYCKENGGESGPEGRVRLPSGRYRKPDVAYWKPGIPSGNDSVPTLAVEVCSPGETMASQRDKCREYRTAGAEVVWLIDPISRSAEVFEGQADAEPLPADGTLTSEYLPGLEVSSAELFAILGQPDGAPRSRGKD
jgi:Uma2 family endonuclease